MKNLLTVLSIVALFFSTSAVFAEVEVSGKITIESAKFTSSGTSQGAATAHGTDNFKNQTDARIYVDGDVGANTFHVELQAFNDGKAINGVNSNEEYTQRDFLREAYIDSEIGDWSMRVGKQQVVWGTADGIKLLDLINPTDYSEMVQNVPEDSRIPTWMINAETDLADGSNFQIVVSQPRENIFAGLNRSISTAVRTNQPPNQQGQILDIAGTGHNEGQAFVLKGVDTITGRRNGFLNIAPDLGSIAASFGGGFTGLTAASSFGGLNPEVNPLATIFTVGAFTSGATLHQLGQGFARLSGATDDSDGFEGLKFAAGVGKAACQNPQAVAGFGLVCAADGSSYVEDYKKVRGVTKGSDTLDGFGAGYDSNLSSFAANDGDNSAFEYMKLASFATFDAFVNARSQYIFDMPEDNEVNLALRYKKSLDSGLNYSFNYSYNYDTNPVIDLSWRNDAGEVLKKSIKNIPDAAGTGRPGQYVKLVDAAGNVYGSTANRSPILTFEQTLERAHNFGASMDTSIDTEGFGAVVLRAEALYQKDVYSPIIDKSRLSFGDLTDALKMLPGDRLKYVLGVDITVLTNMLISTQFIQDRNLDYVDGRGELDAACSASVAGHNAPPPQGSGLSLDANQLCARYTADFASMHLTNGLLKAKKNKNFVSLFLSKPFGSSAEHRWNNIIIFEDQGSGGFWNRFDLEYSIDDDAIFTAEWNRYWGEDNSQFGQLKDSSNIQLGFKYSF